MPNVLRILLTFAGLTFLYSGAAGYSQINMVRDTTIELEGDSVYVVLEEMAQYPGGMNALVAFLSQNVQYPARARMQGDQGSVFVSFIVEKSGRITHIDIVKGISDDLDQESIRVVKLFPAWVPGKKDGRNVRTRYVLPIKYKLQGKRRNLHGKIGINGLSLQSARLSSIC